MKAVENVRIPIIAAIRGACTGGGMSIATACDLRIATPSARFGFPVARTLGNCLSIANYARLVDIVGATMVKEMVYLAKLIDAQRAYELNYVTEIVAEDALLDRAAENGGDDRGKCSANDSRDQRGAAPAGLRRAERRRPRPSS